MSYLLEHFKENPSKGFTSKELSSLFQKEKSTISRNLKRLLDLSKIKISKTEVVGKQTLKYFQLNPNNTTRKDTTRKDTTRKDTTRKDTTRKDTTRKSDFNPMASELYPVEKQQSGKLTTQLTMLTVESNRKDDLIANLQAENISILQTIENLNFQIITLDNEKIALSEKLANTVLEPETKIVDFSSFTKMLLSDAIETGSNSCSIGEIKFRRSSIKNIYLLITKYQKDLFTREILKQPIPKNW